MTDPTPEGLATADLTVRYGGVVANSAVSLTLRPREIVGLIGPNGAGKTSFVDAITGFTGSAGAVTLDGADITRLAPHRRRRAGLSRTWQSGELFGNMTVVENVTAALRPGGFSTILTDLFGRRRNRIDPGVTEALRAVGLGDVGAVLARDLTLGQQKLVGVARALVGHCRILLLDEPAAGLDSQESLDFAERMRGIAASGPGILLIDHDISLVLGVCDRIYVMEFGQIIFSGTPAEVRVDPAVIAAYLGAPREAADV
ncbi:ABC transporter ATP-binding protein [Nocardia sp. NPDC024068]|uniref:ABC transporter ATP-binding protein n=1 Tax=Nocardia sp. NPDC024068 TaxID=3157197 RepID=UPI0033C7B6E2